MTLRAILPMLACILVIAAPLRVQAAPNDPPGMPSREEIAAELAAELDRGDGSTTFASDVDLTPLNAVAVNHAGRVNSFESHASSLLSLVTGPNRIHGDSRAFTYLDIIFRPQVYDAEPVIYVKNKLIRAQIAEILQRSTDQFIEQLRGSGGLEPGEFAKREAMIRSIFDQSMATLRKTGLISRDMILEREVQVALAKLNRDLMRTAKQVDQIETAIALANPALLRGELKLIPPANGSGTDAWLTPDELAAAVSQEVSTGIDGTAAGAIAQNWQSLELAWIDQNAPAVNDALRRFVAALKSHADAVTRINPQIYPSESRLSLESWYFRARNMTWVWLIYGLAVVPLLISVVYRWPAARWIGLSMFTVAFGFHTFALLLRYYVSGRWPNANMFEALTTAAWFGSAAAIVFEVLLRRSAMRNIVALGAAVCSMVAFMAVHFLPLELTPNISNKMPVLHDVWLYIHTNVIIFSYALIGMAAVPAAIYLIHRAVRVLAGSYESPATEYARVGGAGSLILTGPRGEQLMAPEKSTFGQVLDGTTMVLMELAFVLLWTGLVMGAIWADHSWGRPWGWDPKEVFALNTFIIFLLLVHVRLKVKDKGLWTAFLAVIGAAVMIFNWVVINFTIAGLHSYA